MIKMVKKWLLLIISYLFLFGCASKIPMKLGINDLEWSSYSQEKQQSLISNYDKIAKEWQVGTKKQVFGKSYLVIDIYGGQIMFPPAFVNWQNYKPIRFVIFEEQCRNVELMQQANKDLKTVLGICFRNNILYLDSSRYDPIKKYGSASIHSSPLWLPGFTYKGVSSHGYVRLNNVTVAIKRGVVVGGKKC